MTWDTAILQPELGLRFVLQIQGVPQLLCDGAAPIGALGDAMPAPTSDGNDYLWVEHALDASKIEDRGAQVSRLTSSVSPTSMSFVLQDDSAGTLLDLLAWDLDGGGAVNLTASAAYDVGATGTITLNVDAHAFSVGDYIWLGRECLKVTARTATTLTCDRDLFSIGDEDASYAHLSDVLSAPRVITDWPRAMVGRYVQLHAIMVDRFGRALDREWGGDHQREVWRGFISANAIPDGSWYRWRLKCEGLESRLQAEVGSEFIGGALVRIPGTAKQNKAGSAEIPEGMPDISRVFIFVEGRLSIDIRFTTTDGVIYDYTGDDALKFPSGIASELGVMTVWKLAVTDTIQADTGARVLLMSSSEGYRINVLSSVGSTCEFFWDTKHSVGPQLGFNGYAVRGGFHTLLHAGTQPAAVWIPPWAQIIPFYYVDDSGQNSVTAPPSSGYAMFGSDDDDDPGEIISYSSITASDIDGLYELRGVERARMGTSARPIIVTMAELESAPDPVSIRFGVGWENTPALQVILELAQSTGGGHHGTYDTLPATAGAGINPDHFDNVQIMEVAGNLSPSMASVSLFVSKATKLGDLAADMLAPLGVVLQARYGTGYAIQAVEIMPPLESEATAAVTGAELTMKDPARHRAGRVLVNRIEVNYHWDAAAEEPVDGAVVTARDRVSWHDHGDGTTLDWTLVGRRLSAAQALALVSSQARTIFSLYGQPYEVLDLPVGRSGWLIDPGATISLTLAGVPTARGTRGVTARLATVLSVSKTWAGEQPGAVLRVLMGRYARRSTYVPAAKAASISGAAVTCEANEYTDTGRDSEHFEAGDVCWVYQEFGAINSRVERTVLSVSGNVLTFTASIGFASGSHTIITGADYDVASPGQAKHVHIADAASPPVLSVSNSLAFRYV